jgi:hypothetical protein
MKKDERKKKELLNQPERNRFYERYYGMDWKKLDKKKSKEDKP